MNELPGPQSFGVVLGDLIGEEEHVVPLGKALREAVLELGRGKGNRHTALHVKSHHAVEQEVALALRDHLGAPLPGDEHGKLPHMGADEIPRAVFGPGLQPETVLQSAVRLVRGDHQVLLDRRARDLPVRALLLVEGTDVCDHEAGGQHGLLDGVPDGALGVVENDRDPPTGLQDAAVRLEASLHQALIVGDSLALRPVDDGLCLAAGADAVPGFDQVVEVGVEYVFAKRRISEHVVDGIVR